MRHSTQAVAGRFGSVPAPGPPHKAARAARRVALWNGQSRPTTFVSSTVLQVALTAADLVSTGSGQITVSNPQPGGGTSAAMALSIISPPTLNSVTPGSLNLVKPVYNAPTPAPTSITLSGSNFAANATVQANGGTLTITSQTSTQIVAALPANYLYSSGVVSLTVTNPGVSGPSFTSQPVTLAVINPTATFSVQPSYAATGSADTTISLYGDGFFADTVVQWNGIALQTTYSSSSSISALVPASLLARPGIASLTIATPENGSSGPPAQTFSTYVALPVNDVVWSSRDSLLYATVAGTAGPGLGNSLVGIDPVTGTVVKSIFVGSEPNRLVLSADGTNAFVGLDSAGSIRQVNLVTGVAGVQTTLGGGPGLYNPPFTAKALATPPGQPNTVAVYASSGVVTVYDSGVARSKSSSGLQTYFTSNYGGLAFGADNNTLYVTSEAIGSYVYLLTVDSTGITSYKQLGTSGSGRTLQYDNGRLYFPSATVADATTGATLGQFSTINAIFGGSGPANGPIASDSALNRAFIIYNSYGYSSQVLAFDESTFNPIGSLNVTGIGAVGNVGLSSPADLVRWGQNGLAFHTTGQLYILQSSIVKDVSASPADLSVTASLPSTTTTGTAASYQLTVHNAGPNSASGVSLSATLPSTVIFGTPSSTQGTCSSSASLLCDLGTIASGASVTVTLSATPTVAGSFSSLSIVDSQSFDPTTSNNQVTASSTASGALFSAVPTLSQISPKLVASGSDSFTLTVTGAGFTTASSVLWNGTSLPTSFTNSTTLTATVDSSLVKSLGWSTVSVSSASPGGGVSAGRTLTIYALLKVPANAILYDPFTRMLYAAIPSTATTVTGNTILPIDPTTAAFGTVIPVGSEPNLLAETTSGNSLDVGLSGAKSLARVNLPSQTLDLTLPLTSKSYFNSVPEPTAATALAAIPGAENSIYAADIGILDISGTSASVRANTLLGYTNLAFTDSTHFLTSDSYEIYRYVLNSSGLSQLDGTSLLGFGGFGTSFALDGGLLFGSSGGIVNPSTTVPSQVGVLPLGVSSLYNSSLIGAGVVPYAAEQKAFVIGVNAAGTALTFAERFDTTHLVLEDTISLPTDSLGPQVFGTRWSQDGLAYLLPPGYGTGAQSQIMLLRGPFVLPAESSSNAAPTLSSLGATAVSVGSGNQYLSVVGTGFLPGASVLWNGSIRDTVYVDAQHLSAAISAHDVAAAASISITTQNPGSAGSSSLTLTVQ